MYNLRLKHYCFTKMKNSLFLRDLCRGIKHNNSNPVCYRCQKEIDLIKEDFQKLDEHFIYMIDLIDIINKNMDSYRELIDDKLEPVVNENYFKNNFFKL